MTNGARSTALVMAGGGALGAYEAGVLLYALEALPGARFDIFAGTSVGALNASHLAANADDPARAARHLAAFWRSITFDKILRFRGKELTSLVQLSLGLRADSTLARLRRRRPPRGEPHPPVAGLFDTTPLYQQMETKIPWQQLQANLADGTVRGIAFCATEVCTGTSIIFYQTSDGTRYRSGQDPAKAARPVKIGVSHAMASAAMPFLFPAVQIGGVCYTDGSLRQNTPLNPALRMGADRILVVSLTQDPVAASRIARLGCRRNPYPGALFLLGKTINVFLSQSLDYELNRVEMYNRLIAGGQEIYGEGFLEQLNRIMGDYRNATYRPVRTCHLRPSRDLHGLALETLRRAPKEMKIPGIPGRVIGRLLRTSALAESDLLGVLMFTPSYIRALLDLGYADARANRERLERFFAD